MKQSNLTEGSILKSIVKLAIPIMGTSFVQMAYNMTDMIWIGELGSFAVAAVGTAGFFTWLAVAFILISRIGAEIGVAQSIGSQDIDMAKSYARSSLQLNFFISIVYSVFLLVFRKQLIGFFKLGDLKIVEMAVSYLFIVSLGLVFYFANQVFSGILNGYGDSKTPFIINAIGLLANMILDPMLIFGIGPFPKLEVRGAAIATITAQFIVFLIFVFKLRGYKFLERLNLFSKPDIKKIRQIVKLGLPVAMQEGGFATFAMVLARIISQWGPVAIAVQKVGSQIEAISWMTSGGFSTALAAFVGQNYGAKKWERIYKGYFTAIGLISILGISATLLLYFAAGPIFSIFITEHKALKMGIVYLKILSLSQFFMCIEITTAGAFNGMGNTFPPALVGILFTGLRIPAALILSQENVLGLNGVWWSISLSSIFKGTILVIWFMLFVRRHPNMRRISRTLKQKSN